jgi:nucleoside-diphosphate-sugar epimerase
VAGHDAVINLATKIPPPSRAAFPSAWAESHRLRTEASAVLAQAALDAGVPRLLQESIAFMYPDRGEKWIDEDVPLDPPELARGNVAAEAAGAGFAAAGGTAVVLRFGQFYAPESVHTLYMRRMARRRLPALPGPRSAYAPAIAADDAASAVVAALHVPGGTWNVTDDRPLTRMEFHSALADLLGVKPPLLTGTTILGLHPYAAFYLRSQRVSNQRFAAATGWSPRHPDAASGWRAMIGDMPR